MEWGCPAEQDAPRARTAMLPADLCILLLLKDFLAHLARG